MSFGQIYSELRKIHSMHPLLYILFQAPAPAEKAEEF